MGRSFPVEHIFGNRMWPPPPGVVTCFLAVGKEMGRLSFPLSDVRAMGHEKSR